MNVGSQTTWKLLTIIKQYVVVLLENKELRIIARKSHGQVYSRLMKSENRVPLSLVTALFARSFTASD